MSNDATSGEVLQKDSRDAAELCSAPAVGGTAKRTLDVGFALVLLFLLAPLILLTIAALMSTQGRPVVIRHKRIGKGGRPFDCLKFRTMILDGDRVLEHHLLQNEAAREEWARARKLKNDPRVTRLGAVLRRTSIDELPQLINVLKGEMSVVGPRPIVDAEVPKYGAAFTEYKLARPGLTGSWQVSGRNDLKYDDRVRLDREYVRTWSLHNDTRILVKTIPAVISRRGCY